MSALRGLQRAQLWNNSSNYICHSCRQKLQLQLQLGRRQLTRSQTQLSTSEGSGGDDWLSNFNDLSELNSGSKKENDKTVRDAFKRVSGLSSRRGRRDAGREREKAAEGRGSEVKIRDALCTLVDDLEKNAAPPSRRRGSPSFSRRAPVARLRGAENVAKDREIQANKRFAYLMANVESGAYRPPPGKPPSTIYSNLKGSITTRIQKGYASRILAEVARQGQAMVGSGRENLIAMAEDEQSAAEAENAKEPQRFDSEDHDANVIPPPSKPHHISQALQSAFEDPKSEHEDIHRAVSARAAELAEWRMAEKSANVSGRSKSGTNLAAWKRRYEKHFWKIHAKYYQGRGEAGEVIEDNNQYRLEEKTGEEQNRLDVMDAIRDQNAVEGPDVEAQDNKPYGTPFSKDNRKLDELKTLIFDPYAPEEDVRQAISLRADIMAETRMARLARRGRTEGRDLAGWKITSERESRRLRAKALAGPGRASGISGAGTRKGSNCVGEGRNVSDQVNDMNAVPEDNETFEELMSRVDQEGAADNEYMRVDQVHEEDAILSLRPMTMGPEEAVAEKPQEEQSRKFEETLKELMPSIHGIIAKATGQKQVDAQTTENLPANRGDGATSKMVDVKRDDEKADLAIPLASERSMGGEEAASADDDEHSLATVMASLQGVLSKSPTEQERGLQNAVRLELSHRDAAASALMGEARIGTKKDRAVTATPANVTRSTGTSSDDRSVLATHPTPVSTTVAEATSSATPEPPAFPSATSRIWSEWDTPIPPPNGVKPPPQNPPAFAQSPKNPFTSRISPLSKPEALSLAKQVEEANTRPKWGGVSTVSKIEPLSIRSTVRETDHADNIAANAPFRPFGLNAATPSESVSSNANIRDSLQKLMRFDANATASSKALDNGVGKDAKPTKSSDSKTPVTSWLWNKLIGKLNSEDISTKQTQPETTANPSSAHDLNEVQQKLGSEVQVNAKSEDSEAVGAASPDLSMPTAERAVIVSKPYWKFQVDDQASLKTPGTEQVNEQDDSIVKGTEADVRSPSSSPGRPAYFRTDDSTSTLPQREAALADQNAKRAAISRRPLNSGRLGALAELNEDLIDEAKSLPDDHANIASRALEPSTVTTTDIDGPSFHDIESVSRERARKMHAAGGAATGPMAAESPAARSNTVTIVDESGRKGELEASKRLANLWSVRALSDVPSSDAQSAQGAAISEAPSNSAGDDSVAMGGGSSDGNDDGDDKPLWEVMSKAAALTKAEPAPEAQSEWADTGGSTETDEAPLDLSSSEPTHVSTIKPSELEVKPLGIPQPPVPGLEYGLDRVLFNPGVYQLQDPHSRVYNFDPYLQKIMPVVEFDFNALKEYKTSSQDTMLSALANEHGKRYIGSTSSMTGMLGHFHYLLSDWRPLNLNMLSRGFADKLDNFTLLNRAPNAIFLRWKNGTYAIDADKQYDSGNVLMLLGKSMEKLLTTPTSEYERYRKSDPREVSEEERTAPEAFEYTTMGDFLMRSQLDAHDPRLPGTGMFDLKTRAVLSVRMDSGDFQPMTGYEIYSLHGRFQSYEREFYDMMRSTMLKYMLQARMGRMDGIFIAYHNVERIFGFQYLPISEIDRAIHGQVDRCLGDQEFKTSLDLVNKIFNKATAKFPQQSLRFHFETTTESLGGKPTAVMWTFAEPMTDSEIDNLQSTSKAKVEEFERSMMGVEKDNPLAPTEHNAPTIDRNAVSAGADQTTSATSSASELSSALSSSSSEFITIHAEGDSGFLNAMTNATAMDVKPLFAASLICRSSVNGRAVERPENLKPADSWEIEYLLREWDAPERMWPRYEAMKARRQEMFDKLKNEEEMGEGNGNGELTSKQKKERAYIDFLRGLSQSGREWRSRLEKSEAGKIPVIVGQPLPASSNVIEESVGSVDQYTTWLYGTGKS